MHAFCGLDGLCKIHYNFACHYLQHTVQNELMGPRVFLFVTYPVPPSVRQLRLRRGRGATFCVTVEAPAQSRAKEPNACPFCISPVEVTAPRLKKGFSLNLSNRLHFRSFKWHDLFHLFHSSNQNS
jgi:hypothetical protein